MDDRAYLPSCWDDDVRMNALFSDFRSRTVNPTGWDAKLNFWIQSIVDWCRFRSDKDKTGTTFSFRDLRLAFSRHGRSPSGLSTVITEMTREGQLMTVSEFLRATADPGWVNWSWDILVKRPLSYSWSLISKSLWSVQDNENDEFVCVDLLKEKSMRILQRHRTLVESGDEDNTVSLEVLASHCKDICKSVNELELCLLWLRKERSLTLHTEQQHKIVKFFGDGPSRQPHKVTQLSQSERALVQLKKVKKSLEHQIELHEAEAEKYKNEAKNHLKVGSRPQAKIALQKKKQAEAHLVKKEHALDNIEVLLNQLKDVDTQKAVLDALQSGSNAFKADNLDLDKVDETLSNVQETLEIQKELQETLGRPLGVGEPSISELEKELEDILASGDNNAMKRPEKAAFNDVFEYPEPPTDSPGKEPITPNRIRMEL